MKNAWRKTIRAGTWGAVPAGENVPLKQISGRVWSLGTDDGLYKAEEEISPELSLQKLSFPFLFTSFSWMNKDAYDNKTRPQYTQSDSDKKREFFKEITGKPDGKNGLTQITDNLSNKFSARFINDNHQHKFTIMERICQGEFRIEG